MEQGEGDCLVENHHHIGKVAGLGGVQKGKAKGQKGKLGAEARALE